MVRCRMAFPEFTIPQSSVRVMRHGGGSYRVMTAWPAQAPPEGGFPVVCLLDADTAFGTMVEAIRLRSRRPDATGVPPAVVVGVSHDGDDAQRRERRTFDFTTSGVVPPVGEFPDGRAPRTGGASAFLTFLVDEVLATIEGEQPVDTGRRMLFGHSLGGLLAVHSLFARPAAFRTVVAASPSIWWDAPRVMAAAEQFMTSDAVVMPRVFLSAGEFEQTLAPWQPDTPFTEAVGERRTRRRMVDHVTGLADRLGPIGGRGGNIHCEIFPGADHASVVTLTISQCLRFGLQDTKPT